MMSDVVDDLGVPYFPEGGSYQQFIEQHLLSNQPCLFGEWATRNWGARKDWVLKDGLPNLDYFRNEFGHSKVSVANCSECKFFTHPKTEMRVSEFMEYWQSCLLPPHQAHGRWHSTAATSSNQQKLYLKDWHFVKEFPEHGSAAYVPHPFLCSDWLNEVWSIREDVMDDYKFVYMGPTGTWTPFHADVLRSYSWSANITGSKEWLLFPPNQENLLRDKLGNLPFDIKTDEWRKKIDSSNAPRPIRVIQKAGEIIFVPSGWHHQVTNLKHTISINHNWNNAFSLHSMWTHLQLELQLVKRELRDCMGMEGWQQQCQVLLKASAGMDYWEFAQFIVILAMPRLRCLKSLPEGDNAYTELKQFVDKVATKHTITFFKSGSFPHGLYGKPLSDSSLISCLNVQANFKEFVDVFPSGMKQLLEQGTCDSSSGQVYRAFELLALSSVAKELIKILEQ